MSTMKDDGMFARAFRCASENSDPPGGGAGCYGLELDESDYAITESDSREMSEISESEMSDTRVKVAQKSENSQSKPEKMSEIADREENDAESAIAADHSESLESQVHVETAEVPVEATGDPLVRLVRLEIMRALEPVLQAVQVERHFAAVAAAHPDYERIAQDPDLMAWIDEQPAFMADTLKNIAEHGSAPQVIDLLTRYKQDRAPAAPSMSGRARNLEAVRSKGGGPPKTTGRMQDFSGAWDEAAAVNE